MHIIEELWYGNIQPMEQDSYRIEEHRDLVRLFEKNEQKLIVSLDDNQKDLLQKMKDLVEEMTGITECAAFMTGFRLGVQFMTAAQGERW